MPAAMISSACGPAPLVVAMPSVNTEDPEIPSAEAKSRPLSHHMTSEKPSTRRHSHNTKSVTMAAGPTKDRTRSRTS